MRGKPLHEPWLRSTAQQQTVDRAFGDVKQPEEFPSSCGPDEFSVVTFLNEECQVDQLADLLERLARTRVCKNQESMMLDGGSNYPINPGLARSRGIEQLVETRRSRPRGPVRVLM